MINSKTMKLFLKKAVSKLKGNWIIIGGTVLPLSGIDYRVTVDIDIVNLNFEQSNNDNIKLMEIAEELKLPIESINQAGAFFLSKFNDVDNHLVLLKESKNCKIYRPDVYLYVKLKIERLTMTDLEDCIHFIRVHKNEYETHKKKISKIINNKLKSATYELRERLNKLNSLYNS